MWSISELLSPEKAAVHLCSTRSVTEAVYLMARKKQSAVAVMVDGQFDGIFTHTDFRRRVLQQRRNPKLTALAEVTTRNPATTTPDCQVWEAYEMISGHGFSHLPVVSAESGFLGMLSQRDLRGLITARLQESMREASMLRNYAFGASYSVAASG